MTAPETPNRPREPLSRARILDAALALLSTEGIEALSMRRLADALDVEPMSLYRHVPNKAAVLSGLAELVLQEIEVPSPDQDWAERLRLLGHAMRQAFERHPGVVAVLASHEATLTSLTSLAPIENTLDALHDAGLDELTAIHAYRTLVSLVFGQAVLATGGLPGTAPGGVSLPVDVPAALLPRLHAALHLFPAADTVDDFDFGLNAIIAAIRQAANSA